MAQYSFRQAARTCLYQSGQLILGSLKSWLVLFRKAKAQRQPIRQCPYSCRSSFSSSLTLQLLGRTPTCTFSLGFFPSLQVVNWQLMLQYMWATQGESSGGVPLKSSQVRARMGMPAMAGGRFIESWSTSMDRIQCQLILRKSKKLYHFLKFYRVDFFAQPFNVFTPKHHHLFLVEEQDVAMAEGRFVALHPQPSHRPQTEDVEPAQHPRTHLVVPAPVDEKKLSHFHPGKIFARSRWLSMSCWLKDFKDRLSYFEDIEAVREFDLTVLAPEEVNSFVGDRLFFLLGGQNGVILIDMIIAAWEHDGHHLVLGESVLEGRVQFVDGQLEPVVFGHVVGCEGVQQLMFAINSPLSLTLNTETSRNSPQRHCPWKHLPSTFSLSNSTTSTFFFSTSTQVRLLLTSDSPITKNLLPPKNTTSFSEITVPSLSPKGLSLSIGYSSTQRFLRQSQWVRGAFDRPAMKQTLWPRQTGIASKSMKGFQQIRLLSYIPKLRLVRKPTVVRTFLRFLSVAFTSFFMGRGYSLDKRFTTYSLSSCLLRPQYSCIFPYSLLLNKISALMDWPMLLLPERIPFSDSRISSALLELIVRKEANPSVPSWKWIRDRLCRTSQEGVFSGKSLSLNQLRAVSSSCSEEKSFGWEKREGRLTELRIYIKLLVQSGLHIQWWAVRSEL